jgi:hypothetical protein
LDRPISLNELIIDMILGAWYPHGFCRLSLGSLDMLQKTVDTIQWGKIKGSWIQAGSDEWNRLRRLCSEHDADIEKLCRYVPFRLIRPFFSRETKGLPDYQVNGAVISLSSAIFAKRKPLYCFTADRKGLILNLDSWIPVKLYQGKNKSSYYSKIVVDRFLALVYNITMQGESYATKNTDHTRCVVRL